MENYIIDTPDIAILPQNLTKSLSSCETYTFGLDLDKATKLDKTELMKQLQETVNIVYERVETYSSLKKPKKIAFVINNGSDIISNQSFRIVTRLGKRVGVYILIINNKNIIKTTLRKHFKRMIIHSEDNIEILKGNYYNDT